MGGRLDILLDNPILTRHARGRLRQGRMIPWSIIVITLCAAICWAFYQVNQLLSMTPLTLVILLQIVTLVFAGAGEIGSSVGGTRESGILDFHRVTPVPPLWLAVGFVLGAPLLQYWLTLLTLPFAIFLAVVGPAGLMGLLWLEIPLILAAGLVHTLTLLGAMVSKKPRAGNRGLIGLMIFGLVVGSSIVSGIQSALINLSDQMARIEFFGLPVPWVLLVVVYEIILIGFLFIPSVRRLRSDRAHLYTKPQAIAFMATIVVLVLGVTWTLEFTEGMTLILIYALAGVAIILTITVTPDRSEYLKGVRRAARTGRRRPSPWSDAGVNRLALVGLCTLVLLGTTVAWEAIEGRDRAGRPPSYSQTIAIGVLTIAYVGLGLQAAQLFMRRYGMTLVALTLFFLWLIPLVAGGGLGWAGYEDTAVTVAAISPLAGLTLSSGLMSRGAPDLPLDAVRIAALLPAVGLTFLLQALLELIQRRIDQAVRGTSARRLPDPFDDIFGVPGKDRDPELADPLDASLPSPTKLKG